MMRFDLAMIWIGSRLLGHTGCLIQCEFGASILNCVGTETLLAEADDHVAEGKQEEKEGDKAKGIQGRHTSAPMLNHTLSRSCQKLEWFPWLK